MASYSAAVGLWEFSATLYSNGTPIGYSYKTSQYGLSVDSIVGFNLVLPNGTVTHVTQSTYPDLFFGLKGGFNNFVSRFLQCNRHTSSTYRIPGDRDRFHDDHVPANRCMGTGGPLCHCSPA